MLSLIQEDMSLPDQQLDQLKQKYQSVLSFIQQNGVHLTHVHIQDNKLYIEGATPSEDLKNKVWDQIKKVDPSYSDLTVNLTVDSSLPQAAAASSQAGGASGGAQTYTVQPGDSLSLIAKHFYGDANKYNKIFEANRDQLDNPDRIKAGQTLKIPA